MIGLDLPEAPSWRCAGLERGRAAGLLVRAAAVDDVVRRGRGRLVYLATPYSLIAVDDDGAWCPARSVEAGVRAAIWARALAVEGVCAVSPIVQAVEMIGSRGADDRLDPFDDGFWTAWCRPLLLASSVVVVPPIPGWDVSRGVWREAVAALATNRPVMLLSGGEGAV